MGTAVTGANTRSAVAKGRKKGINKIIKCITLNAQSLTNKMDEFKLVVTDLKPQIISITESWGDECITDGIFALDGYTMYRNDRQEIKGGGTILYISNQIDQRVCRPLNVHDFENSTWCWIVGKGGKKILVGSVYRSPNSSPENDVKLLEKIEKANEIAGENRLLILGDFNVPKIDWENKELQLGARRIERQVLDVVNDCFLHQHVTKPTRFLK